jgi:hypothetical protein
MQNRQPMGGLPAVYLVRHGETAWTLTGQHTGITDLPLTERGECNARSLGERLKAQSFQRVFSSPLQRAPPARAHGSQPPTHVARRRRHQVTAGAGARCAPAPQCVMQSHERTPCGARTCWPLSPFLGYCA